MLIVEGVEPQGKFKAAIAAHHLFLGVRKFHAGENQPFASGLFLVVSHAFNDHAAEVFLVLRMRRSDFGIRFQGCDFCSLLLNLCRKFCQQLIL